MIIWWSMWNAFTESGTGNKNVAYTLTMLDHLQA